MAESYKVCTGSPHLMTLARLTISVAKQSSCLENHQVTTPLSNTVLGYLVAIVS